MDQSLTTLQEIPVEEAIAVAILLQKDGELADAQDVYRKVLDVVPDHPDALHFAGILAHQQGRSADAVALIERSLELAPDRADWYANLGIVTKALGRLDESIVAYQHAIALEPGHANAYSNLGVLLKAQGRPAEAEGAYRTAIRLNPDHVDACHNLGLLLEEQGRTKEAVVLYRRVTTLQPTHPEARELLAAGYRASGHYEKAVEVYREWLEQEPDNPIPQHMLAACSGEGVPARASDAYVESAFDDFARGFDTRLKQLFYRAPALVAAMLADSGLEASKSLDVLDAGCGTGLCGPLIAPYARRLTGVDLSGGMLEKARDRKVYDDLVKGELTAYLRAHEASFDVIVSADTLVYFGALEESVAAAAAALRPAGVFVFTLEHSTGADATAGYALQTRGRYCHTPGYVERVIADAGLRGDVVHAELRMELGVPVPGLVVRATKRAPARVTAEAGENGVSAARASAHHPGESHA